jgi:hypothetical protein
MKERKPWRTEGRKECYDEREGGMKATTEEGRKIMTDGR